MTNGKWTFQLLHGLRVRDNAHDVGIGGELAVDPGLAAHALDARTNA